MKSSDAPIFIHSLFRSGSTYMFNVFRRSDSGYYCYQEPLNEVLINAKTDPKKLLDISIPTQEYLRHPKLDKPYFYEFYLIADKVGEKFKKGFSSDQYFSDKQYDISALNDYFQVLMDNAEGRPVFQCCRTSGRVKNIKSKFKGIDIFLWRNPWDQWWSYRKGFDLNNLLIINAKNVKGFIETIKNELAIPEFHHSDVFKEHAYFSRGWLSSDLSYKLFYALWCHAILEAKPCCDLDIDISQLSNSDSYREVKLKQLSKWGVDGIDFSDSACPSSLYGEVDWRFFEDIEIYIHGLLLSHGYSENQVEELRALSQHRKSLVVDIRNPKYFTVRDAMHVRQYLLEAQTNISCKQRNIHSLESALQQAEQGKQALQSQYETLQAEASQHEQALQQKEGKQQELLISLLEKETKQQETNALLIEGNKQLEQLQIELANRHRQQSKVKVSLQQVEQDRQVLQSQCERLQAEASQHELALQQKEGKQQELLLSLLEKETKQQKTNALLVEGNHQLKQLQTELANSHQQQTAIEFSLQHVEQQRQALQSQCETLQIEASQHEQALQQKEGKQQELLLSLLEKETKQQETNALLMENKHQLKQLQTELVNSHQQQSKIKVSLHQVEQQRQALQSQCETLQAEANQHKQALQQKEAAITGLNSELATVKQEVEVLNQSNHQWWTMADQHSKSLIEADAKIDGLNQSSHHWWLESERLNKELDTVYHSKSWIITWPLRKLSQFFQWLFYLPIKLAIWLVRVPKRIARWILVENMAMILDRPVLRTLIGQWLKKYPRFYNKFRLLALARGLLPQSSKDFQKDMDDIANNTEKKVLPDIQPVNETQLNTEPMPSDTQDNLLPSSVESEGNIQIQLMQSVRAWQLGERTGV